MNDEEENYTYRCSICNKVNNHEICSELSSYTSAAFVPDPSNKLFYICLECHNGIYEVKKMYDDVEELDVGELKPFGNY